jgi:hypothetical protein
MSSDVFERNVSEMVRRAALRPDAGRARERFLRGIDVPEERRSWKLAAAAAAIVVAVTIVWSARTEKPVVVSKPAPKQPPAEAVLVRPSDGNNDLLTCSLRLPPEGSRRPIYHLLGSSSLPDGLIFKVRLHRKREKLSGGRLETTIESDLSAAVELEKGKFDLDWPSKLDAPLRVDVTAPDDFQERDMVKQLRVPESKRRWSFEFLAWDDRLRARLIPQADEVSSLAQELHVLVMKVSLLCQTEEGFRQSQKELVREAEKIRARAEGLARSGLYPASSGELGFIARNLAVSMPNFTWEGGKLAGPKSYYGNGKLENTHRNEPFSFVAIVEYVAEAQRAVGHEFELWILKDVRRAGFQEIHADLLREYTRRGGGVTAMADRLRKNDPTLEEEIRKVSR